MGLCLFRYIPRVQEWDCFPVLSNEWGFWSWAKPSRYILIEFSGIESVNPLYFAPYLIGGLQQASRLNDAVDAYGKELTWERNAGIDIKYGLTKNLTLDLTLNTDFAQVEADDEQVNLTRFSLFFPEKRQFFLERSSIFDMIYGTTGQLFYSRRIGIWNGRQVPVWGGGRLNGRIGDWDIGALVLQTGSIRDEETGDELLPTVNNSVVRVRRKLGINSNSYIGAMSTFKVDPSGQYNLNLGVDAIINTFSNDYLNVICAQTLDSRIEPNFISPKSGKYYLDYQRRSYDHLSYDFNYTRAGYRYNPELGFEYRNDFTRLGAQLGYGWNLAEKPGWIQKHKLSAAGYAYFRNTDGEAETVSITPAYSLTTKSLHYFQLTFPWQTDNFRDTFNLSSRVYVPAGSYRFAQGSLYYTTPTWKTFTAAAILSGGRYYDGWINSLMVMPSLRFAGSWIIDLSYGINQISFRTRDQSLVTHLAGMKVIYMYNTKWTASSYIQYNSLFGRIIWNARLRYNPREGVDLYVVYNDFINTDRTSAVPNLPFSAQRTLLLKLTYTFHVR
jgi:hypothetical protein